MGDRNVFLARAVMEWCDRWEGDPSDIRPDDLGDLYALACDASNGAGALVGDLNQTLERLRDLRNVIDSRREHEGGISEAEFSADIAALDDAIRRLTEAGDSTSGRRTAACTCGHGHEWHQANGRCAARIQGWAGESCRCSEYHEDTL